MSSRPRPEKTSVSAPRVSRGPMRSLFDPKLQPWVPSAPPFSAAPSHSLTPDALRAVLRGKIDRALHIPDESKRRLPGREGAFLEAAVLVPLVMREQGVTVLLTQRTAHLNDHAGQISFPGGRIEAEDADEVAAALRETEEETGLHRDFIEVLGSLPRYFTSSGFAINPVTALVQPDFTLAPDEFEVAEVFEVPLSFITDPANYRLHSATLPDGAVRQFYSAPWQKYFIWGATAAMLFGLTQVLAEANRAS